MVTTDQPASDIGLTFPRGKAHSEVLKLLSIGEFARQSRLSPKALRIYDEIGILPPARTYQPCHRTRRGALAAHVVVSWTPDGRGARSASGLLSFGDGTTGRRQR